MVLQIMIISNSGKYIFIHIPKCGGTTASHHLGKHLRAQDVSLAMNPHEGWKPFLDNYQKRFGLNKHSSLREVVASVGMDAIAEYDVFTFVRNPFSRAYSAYTFTKRADARHRPNSTRYQVIKDLNFEEFLQCEYVVEKKMPQSRLQSDWIICQNIPIEIFKLEEISVQLPKLISKYHRSNISGEIPRQNKSSEEGEWKKMSKKAESLIVDLYKKDFERLRYPKNSRSELMKWPNHLTTIFKILN